MVALNWVEGGDGKTKSQENARSSGEGVSVKGSQYKNWSQGFYHVPWSYNPQIVLCV